MRTINRCSRCVWSKSARGGGDHSARAGSVRARVQVITALGSDRQACLSSVQFCTPRASLVWDTLGPPREPGASTQAPGRASATQVASLAFGWTRQPPRPPQPFSPVSWSKHIPPTCCSLLRASLFPVPSQAPFKAKSWALSQTWGLPRGRDRPWRYPWSSQRGGARGGQIDFREESAPWRMCKSKEQIEVGEEGSGWKGVSLTLDLVPRGQKVPGAGKAPPHPTHIHTHGGD